jgi:hypothetical protein
MNQPRQSEQLDAADIFHRIRLQDDDQFRAMNDEDSNPTSFWDGRDQEVEEKPRYDSRAGA